MSDEALLQYMVPGSTVDDIVSYDDDDYYDDYDVIRSNKANGATTVRDVSSHPNAQKESTSMNKFQPAQHKHVNPAVLGKIHIDSQPEYGGGGSKANQRVLNELRDLTMTQSAKGNASKDVDKSERATVENVMDPRTRLILYKLVNSGILKEINGCVSTGKEANVYFAVSGDDTPAALKVYKTSILVFRDRDQYVSGEYRFQRYCKSNPRKMVRTWAEKEARNLNRLQQGGVLAPAVKLLRQHVLVMEFIGEDGWPAPRLKEVKFPSHSALDQCYLDLCCTIRKMYSRCRLIHADLSEYNLLLYKGRVIVIDVSQSVENDHPRAMDFLRRDLCNVNAFFRAQGHSSLFTVHDLFFFVTAPPAATGWQRNTGEDNSDEILQHLRDLREKNEKEGKTYDAKAEIDEQVFLNISVPRTLNEIADHKAPTRRWPSLSMV
ncbi:RIO kinase 1 [Angomonas deanei]|nr:RIO kinase 1 [Angomonas deanei]|eukprot:EPY30129.1 RIO kinase 1 [Angomonas deanei]